MDITTVTQITKISEVPGLFGTKLPLYEAILETGRFYAVSFTELVHCTRFVVDKEASVTRAYHHLPYTYKIPSSVHKRYILLEGLGWLAGKYHQKFDFIKWYFVTLLPTVHEKIRTNWQYRQPMKPVVLEVLIERAGYSPSDLLGADSRNNGVYKRRKQELEMILAVHTHVIEITDYYLPASKKWNRKLFYENSKVTNEIHKYALKILGQTNSNCPSLEKFKARREIRPQNS